MTWDAVVTTLQRIWSAEAAAKVLVFCQWDELKDRVSSALRKAGVDHLFLAGGTADRDGCVREFARPTGPAVLLLSMRSPSGLDLSLAHHVILVQPTWHAESDDSSVDFEAQSIGRCWRFGQTCPVTIYRLCTRGTIEEDVVDRHVLLWSTRFGALNRG